MIDLVTPRYDWAGSEIIKAVIAFSNGTESHRSRIWQEYFRSAGPARWREFVNQAGFAVARYALREFSHHRAFGGRDSCAAPDSGQLERRFKTLIHVRSLWGAAPEFTDWNRLGTLLTAPLGTLESDRES